jgi:ferredoxin-NADP reductase
VTAQLAPTGGAPATTEPELEARVAGKEPLADGVVRLTLVRTDGSPMPAWQPGAHVDLVLGPDLTRQYSLCGDPADNASLTVAVLREPGGRGGSVRVHDGLAAGDTVRVRGPRNRFALVEAPGITRYLFVAGGIGITPLLQMIAAVDARGADWRLLYGGRRRASMAFAAELVTAHPGRVELCPQDEVGLPDLDALLGTPRPDTAVYCCGPEPLLAAVEERCVAWPPGALHVERFSPRPVTVAGSRPEPASFTVELTLSGLTLTVPVDRTILEVVEEAGVPALSSCQEGTCGTCETPVLAGVPDHRDSLLTDAERAAGDAMLICVSRSRTEHLVLEL